MSLKIVSVSNINNPDGSVKEVLVQFIGEKTAFIDYVSGTVKLPADFHTLSSAEQVESVLKSFKKEFFPEPFNEDLIKEIDDKVTDFKSVTEGTINATNIEVMNLNTAINVVTKQILKSDMNEEDYAELISIYPEWEVEVAYKVGNLVRFDGKAWEIIQAHTSQADWSPSETPALFKEVTPKKTADEETGEEVEIVPDFKQPTGAHDAYKKGDKVLFEGKIYVSNVDNNTWSPIEYGWELAEE